MKKLFEFTLMFFLCFVCLSGKSLLASEQIVLDKSQIETAITRHIEKHANWPKGKVRVTFPSEITDIVLPSKNFRLEVKENKNDAYIGNCLYLVKIWHNNKYYKQVFVPTLIEVCREIVLSSKSLRRNNHVSSQDIHIEEKWFSRQQRDLISDPEQIIGKRLLRSISAKSPFTLSMLGNPIMFKKGKIVKILCNNDYLNVTTLGLAEEEGIYGATVKVKNISSNKIIQGRVVGDSVVKVEI